MKLNLNEKKIHYLLFVLILIIAISVRLISWPYGISQINVDEAMTALNAKTISENGVDIYGTSFPVYLEAWGGAGQSVMLMYFMVFFIKLFGFSMVSIRLPMLFISIVSIIVFYDLVKRIFNNSKLALWAMAFVSICPWHLLQSIWSIDCNMFPHFMLISVYFLYRGLTDKKWLLYLSMFFFALTLYTYGVSIYVIPLFLLICAIYLLIKKQIKVKDLIICIVIWLLFSSPILIMYVINALKIDTNIAIGPMTIQYFAANTRTNDMLFFSENIGQTFIANLKSLFQVIFLQYDYLEWNATKIFGTVYHISLVFFLIGGFHFIRHKEKRNTGTFFFGVWLVLSFILGIIINGTNINRLNTIWFPILFFSFCGIYVVCKNIFKGKKLVRYSIIAVYTILFVGFVTYLYTSYTNEIDMSGCFARKITDAIHYATTSLEKDVIYFDHSSNIYFDIQDALDSTTSTRIDNIEEFKSKLENKLENEAFLINYNDLNNSNIDINSYKSERFGDMVVLY